ncbi:ATP-grasp domain-containing protein [Myroides odoratimimus]|uniref:ATP-grasp domain-containing protein n=3 Tax=Myroides odoratimimus TaxID=76832 RepID=UPI00103E59B6|nr:ATP-grasp domain-containing protein [Myroides odoratimimus]MCA4791768.1 ATP-grasp domain-containing protein [Myroides odoratimimus]MCA4805687.1 ATP-grasp domain-containing protein [Myroides odoratimimus]MCA4819029.1 ATP-grasp domain-containing protein [Myroides odoratimimus]MDM1059136.1 ATP-grasp domain-containing protein [Myroides odoratimimus]MDM1091776.1 ATP-grasp domain-containing protein [Myroides odoratimimus]
MRTYIQTDKEGNYYNVNAFIANEGFKHFGYETIKYVDVEDIVDTNPEDIVVGGIGNVRRRLKNIGIDLDLTGIDYPQELRKYLKREIWTSTLEEILEQKRFGIFVKPDVETKKFAGKVFNSELDFIGLIDEGKPTVVLCSELVDFKAEYRCFIRYRDILDIRRYKGDWDKVIDVEVVRQAIADFDNQPNAYALDFGVTETGDTVLVEVNEGHSLGSYGLSAQQYAKFLSARWAEMTGTVDYLSF